MKKNMKYMVMFVDDDNSIYVPCGLDPDCDGALQTDSVDNPPVMFESRSEASKAIKISVALARLKMAQGEPHNEDFVEAVGNVRIVPVVMQVAKPQE